MTAAAGMAVVLVGAAAGLGLQAGAEAPAKSRSCRCTQRAPRAGRPDAYVVVPRRLGVDEKEYSVYPSYNPVGSGRVEFHVTNFGMDAHDFSIRDRTGAVLSSKPLGPGENALVTVRLAPGRYTLFCSLSDHEALGMRARLTVR
jgi:plastocyanin